MAKNRTLLHRAARPACAIVSTLAAIACALAADATPHPSTWPLWLDVPALHGDADTRLVLPPANPAQAEGAWLDRWGRTAPSIAWTDIVVELIVKYQQNPLRATRVLALTNAAMHDALVLCAREHCGHAATRVAQHAAAGRVLRHMYPQESPGRFEALARSASFASVIAERGDENVAHAWGIGTGVAQRAIARALDDGADRPRDLSARPRERPGLWRAAPPLNIYDPAEPRAAEWRTWVLTGGSEIEPQPPIEYGSAAYWAEVEEVRRVAASLTARQKKIAEDWNLDLGTVTPAGVWNLHARGLALERGLDTAQTARLFAALNAAMMDAFIACWHAKYKWWTQRPVTAIRGKLDPQFLPHIVTPPFPSYVSGHSSASGAASVVLSAFFPEKAEEFRRMAEEAAVSRLYGGIHFTSDNAEGLTLGRRIGERVVARLFPQAAK